MSRRTLVIPPGFRPDGVDTEVVALSIQLVKGTSPVIGYHDEQLVVGASAASMDGESAEMDIPVNEDVSPIGTRWKVLLTTAGKTYKYFAAMPAGADEITIDEFLGWTA